MKIANTRRINEDIMCIFKIQEFNTLIMKHYVMPINFGMILEDSTIYDEFVDWVMKKHNCTKEKAIIAGVLYNLIDEQKMPIPHPIMSEILNQSKVIKKSEFENNPYLKNIRFEEQKLGNYELKTRSYEKYETFIYNVPFVTKSGIQIPRIGVLDEDFIYPCIQENDVTWMSITPNEIYTMRPAIARAKGNVLTLGCGLGYFAYMAARKENVSKVTIVEKSQDVINLFKTYILPQFECRDKIEIVQADAFEYMDTLEDGVFDYCFADIWLNNADASPYIELKKRCKRLRKTKVDYWIEESLLETIKGCVLLLIAEEFYKNLNMPFQANLTFDEKNQDIYDYINEVFRDVSITRPEQLLYYLDSQNLKHLL